MAESQKIRRRTCDVAFTYRMPAGFPGDVNRMHPASIVAEKHSTANPVAFFGYPVVVDSATSSVRGLIASDTAVTKIHGVAVRPYPTQSATNTFGVGAPAAGGVVDNLRSGFICAQLPTGSAAPAKEGAVFVWIAASAGANTQGGFVSAASGSNTVAITNARFVGGMDANNVAEIEVFRA